MWNQLKNYVQDFKEQLPAYQEKFSQQLNNWRTGEGSVYAEIEIGKYTVRILNQIAEGGYSCVYLAEEVIPTAEISSSKKRKYALKRIACGTNEQVEDAQREIKVMESMDHPNIMRILGHTMVDASVWGLQSAASKHVCMLFDLYDGNVWDAVQSRMKSGAVLGEDEMRHVFLQLCMALQAMHENKNNPYSHCDVKPHNLMMKPCINSADNSASKWANLCAMQVVLMDFGSVKPAIQKIESRAEALKVQEDAERFTTAPYRAPELWDVSSNCNIDTKVDVWAAGCVLYYLLVGESPFERTANEAGGSLMLSILNCSYSWPKGKPVPEKLKDIVQACLIVDPQQRPAIREVIMLLQDETKVDAPLSGEEFGASGIASAPSGQRDLIDLL